VNRARRHPWYDVGWPLLAGLAAGLGLVAAYRWTGPVIFVVALAVLELTIAPIVWSLLTELGHSVRGVVVRISPTAALGALAVLGLADVVGAWTFAIGGLVLVTSPLVSGWTRGGFGARLTERVSPRTGTRRRFDEIVAGLGSPDEDLPSL
jgi:hypothetical protein